MCHGLRDISKAVVVLTKLLYASPAWWGFATSADKQRLEAFLRRGVRLNLYSALNPSVSCSVAVPPTLHVIFILTATPLFLLVAVAIGLEYNAAHSCCRGCRRSSTVCVESRIEQSSSVCCYSYYVESDNDAVDRRRSHFVIVRLEVVHG